MIGDNIEILRDAFTSSKDAGKPWQIWASPVPVAPMLMFDFAEASSYIDDATTAEMVANFTDTLLRSPTAAFFRSFNAMHLSKTDWNADAFSGFAHERGQILDVLSQTTSNPIILGGDIHDSYVFKAYENDSLEGANPVTVNLISTGVASAGWGTTLSRPLSALSDVIKPTDVLNDGFKALNPGMVYAETGGICGACHS